MEGLLRNLAFIEELIEDPEACTNTRELSGDWNMEENAEGLIQKVKDLTTQVRKDSKTTNNFTYLKNIFFINT